MCASAKNVIRGDVVPTCGTQTASLQAEIERLRRRNLELEGFVEAAEQFAYTASHDLQEPLRTITIYVQLIAKQCGSSLDEQSLTWMQKVIEGTSHMRLLLLNLLAYAEAGVERPVEMVDLDDVIQAVLRDLRPAIDECRAAIISEHLPTLRGQTDEFVRLFQNLIANAIKYRREGGVPHIEISMRREDANLRFAVSDDGVGIDREYHQQIFQPFKRLQFQRVPGTGLGLAICNRVIKRYGGRIWVESTPGSRATFVFVLPASLFTKEKA